MQIADHSDRFAWFIRLATFVLVVAVLRLAQDVLMPIAFAVLLAFLLSPLVVRLTRLGLPRGLAIIVTVTVAFGILGGLGWLVTKQALSLAQELPNYEENLHRKIVALKTPQTPPAVSRMAGMVDNLKRELEAPEPAAKSPPPPGNVPQPVPVEVKPSEPGRWEIAGDIITPILRPLGTAGIVVVFVVAILFQREDLRDRFFKFVSAGKINVATQAIDDAARRVSRYLGMQLVVNASYGVPVGIGLYFIGIPNAPLWALLATLLRFIPFVGPWIAAAFPIALSVAVDPGWTMTLYTLGLFIVMELISNNIIEIVVYGASTGISNMALLTAAVFWTWLWGPAGLVLSTPLTVCVLVLGNYVPGLNFLSMLLGSEPVLEPPTQFYQRMLSMESEEMLDLAAKYIEEHSLEEFYDAVFVPALLLSEEDRHNGALAEVRQRFILQSSRELIDELERQDEPPADAPAETSADLAQSSAPRVVGFAARDEADELVAMAVTHLLRRRGVRAIVNPLAVPVEKALRTTEQDRTNLAFISALPPSAVGAARHTYHRIRARTPGMGIVVCIWRHRADRSELNARLHTADRDRVATSLAEAVSKIEGFARPPAEAPVTESAAGLRQATERDFAK